MAKKTRTELSTLAINTNLPDNTTELITPTTERAQLTDERESVVNYKDDLGGVSNAGKFITVATDGESLTMVDEPTGELSGSGDAARLAFWSAAKVLTYDDYLSWNTSTDTLNAFIVNATSKLIAAIINSPEGNSITLSTQPTGGTLTTRLTISSGGDVTLNSATALDFQVADFAQIKFRESGAIMIDSDNDQSSRNFSIRDGGGDTLMTILDGGDVLIGKDALNNDDVGLWLNNDGASWITQSNTYCLALNRKGTDGTILLFTNDQATAGSISVSGTTTAYNTSSDYRLKENVTPITDALSRVNQLKPSRFNFIADTDKIVDGFLAHEVQNIVPESIHGEKDAMKDEEFELTPRVEAVLDEEGNVVTEAVEAVMETRSVPDYQGIDQSKIVPLLTAAIQEQQTIIENLITRLEALEV